MGIVIEEADESEFWLQMLGDLGLGDAHDVQKLRTEAGELIAIFTTSLKTVLANNVQR